MTIARILVVAGSDSGGGAGIQADIKAITMMGGFAMTAITAITVQNTLGVSGVMPIPPDIIAGQFRAVVDDIGVDAVKVGMLGDTVTIGVVSELLAALAPSVPVIIDPVMIAKGGAALLQADAVSALKQQLLSHGTLLTPNVPELEALTGHRISDADTAAQAGLVLAADTNAAVLVKGGHLEMDGDDVVDQLVLPSGKVKRWAASRIMSRHTHGTGCTLASAVATGLGQGRSMAEAVERGRLYVRRAMHAAPGLGQGHGPLGHAFDVTPYDAIA